MTLRSRLRPPIQRVLATQGLRVVTRQETQALENRYRRAVAQLCGCMSASMFPDVEATEQRIDRVAALRGTDPAEGCFVLARLQAALHVPGDVCEFGVAQGLTSALLASELLASDRRLWLYDSFQGLPAPSDMDILIDDPLGLGDMGSYAGAMAYGSELVTDRLQDLGFPQGRTEVVSGFVTEGMDRSRLPARICFAYIDFDFHDGVKAALSLVHERLSIGGWIVVDDYGYLSSGAKTATDNFIEQAAHRYEVEVGPPWAGHFCMLRRAA